MRVEALWSLTAIFDSRRKILKPVISIFGDMRSLAILARPADSRLSGVMTFIANQDSVVLREKKT